MSSRPLRNLHNITPTRTARQQLTQWQRWEQRQRVMAVPISGMKYDLWTAQAGSCAYCCGSLLPRYHLDHIHPRAKGGVNHPSNYCLACQPCNHAKRDRSVMDFVLRLLLIP
jgi:5-methylcytosine-specific restriction endonuclease McrA